MIPCGPLALGGGGSFRTTEPTPRVRTNARVVAGFLDARLRTEREEAGRYRVALAVTA